MRELMAHSINVWNANAEQLTFHKVGYMQIQFPINGRAYESSL